MRNKRELTGVPIEPTSLADSSKPTEDKELFCSTGIDPKNISVDWSSPLILSTKMQDNPLVTPSAWRDDDDTEEEDDF